SEGLDGDIAPALKRARTTAELEGVRDVGMGIGECGLALDQPDRRDPLYGGPSRKSIRSLAGQRNDRRRARADRPLHSKRRGIGGDALARINRMRTSGPERQGTVIGVEPDDIPRTDAPA